jgi:hypothetical protein
MDLLDNIRKIIFCVPRFEDVVIYEVTENFETIELY